MIEADVRRAAEDLLAGQDMKGYVPTFLGAHLGRARPDQWSVLFELRSPAGGMLDGPVVVLVDNQSGQAEIFAAP